MMLHLLTSSGSKHYLRLGCVLCFAVAVTRAQDTRERLVRVKDPAQITDAVMLSEVSVAGKPLECGLFIKPPLVIQPVTPFQANDDWLRQMTISLINRTDKIIVAGEVLLRFLDTGDCRSQPCVSAELRFGRIPPVDAYDGRTGKPLPEDVLGNAPVDWKPGQTFVLHLSDYSTQIQERLANFMPVSAVSKLNIYRGLFIFNDGMEWNLGRYSVPDQAHPGKVNTLPVNYFPGKRGHNWPPGYNN